MAAVLTIIETECPTALIRKLDEVLINFDALSNDIFHKVNKFVLGVMVHHGGMNKKRKISGVAGALAAKKKG